MKIYVLDSLPKRNAEFHADIHLRNGLLSCVKIFSDAVHLLVPNEIRKTERQYGSGAEKGISHPVYYYKGQELYAPSPVTAPNQWAKWAAGNYMNMWWLVESAVQFAQERRIRFDISNQPEYTKMCRWIEEALTKVFPKKDDARKMDPFPVTVPLVEGAAVTESSVDICRKYYLTLYGRHRLRWTKRDIPPFVNIPQLRE